MRKLPFRVRCCCALMLIGLGGCGILFAPSLGLLGGRDTRSFTFNFAEEHEWGTSVTTSELELPFIHGGRGIWTMNLCLAGSIGVIFGGVHWFAGLRRRLHEDPGS